MPTCEQTCSTSAEEVARDEHRDSGGCQLADEGTDLARALRVEAVGRLVEHEDLPGREECGGDREALLHAQGVLAVALVRRGRQADAGERSATRWEVVAWSAARVHGVEPPEVRGTA